jgi:midasin (ATPase involved in ribosome maturation)
MENQYTYLRSITKFSFIIQRIFIYLIFEGFCGEDDKEEDDKQKEQNDEDDKYFEGGMGMGDGKGGKENVSKEIEHEEQIEGLKNYESDQEKEEKNENEEKNEE